MTRTELVIKLMQLPEDSEVMMSLSISKPNPIDGEIEFVDLATGEIEDITSEDGFIVLTGEAFKDSINSEAALENAYSHLV